MEELMNWFVQPEGMGSCGEESDSRAFYAIPRTLSAGHCSCALRHRVGKQRDQAGRVCQCACAHFLSYGLALRERVRYEFSMADLGTLLHNSLDLFAKKVREQGMKWVDLEDGPRDALAEACVDEVVEKSGETILLSSARNAYTVNRAKRMVKRSVWALQWQLKQGDFYPALTEWAFGPADKIDSLHFLWEKEKNCSCGDGLTGWISVRMRIRSM